MFEKNISEGLLFFAVDIVDSTPLKLLRGQTVWGKTLRKIYENIISLLMNRQKNKTELKLWKFIGDEWIFTQKYKNKDNLIAALNFFDDNILTIMKQEFRIKSRIWFVFIDDMEEVIIPDEFEGNLAHKFDLKNTKSHIISNAEKSKLEVTKHVYHGIFDKSDWIAHTLDIGFRFGKNCYPYHIALSNEVAYILLNNFNNIKNKYIFFTTEKEELKGIGYSYLGISIYNNNKQIKGRETSFIDIDKITPLIYKSINAINTTKNKKIINREKEADITIEKLKNYVEENIIHSQGQLKLQRIIRLSRR